MKLLTIVMALALTPFFAVAEDAPVAKDATVAKDAAAETTAPATEKKEEAAAK